MLACFNWHLAVAALPTVSFLLSHHPFLSLVESRSRISHPGALSLLYRPKALRVLGCTADANQQQQRSCGRKNHCSSEAAEEIAGECPVAAHGPDENGSLSDLSSA
jgi:hypothetical protein